MPHSLLLRALVRLAREHHVAAREGTTPAAVRAERRATAGSRLSRRRFLQAAAAVGAAGAAGALPAEGASAQAPPRVAIIGGGIAGLVAALTLHEAGVPCTVYEAAERLGGRMHSLGGGYWADGQVSEWCGELIDTEHTLLQALCERFGLALDDLPAAEPEGSTATFYYGGQYYRDLDRDFAPVVQALVRDRAAAGYPANYATHTPAAVALDNLSVRDWIQTRVPGGLRSPLGQLLNDAYTIELAAETRELSALTLVYALGSEDDPDEADLFGSSDERYHIHGGNQQLPLAVARALPPDSIRRGWAMTGLARNPDGRLGVGFLTRGGPATILADRVILALPFTVLRRLDCSLAGFDALKVKAIQELGSGRNSKLMVQFGSRYWREAGPWGVSSGATFADTGYQNSWEVSRAQAGVSGMLVNYAGGDRVGFFPHTVPYSTARDPRTAFYGQRFLGQIEPLFPGLAGRANGRAALSLPNLDPWLGLSYSFYRVGQRTTFGGYEGVPQGNVHFAGEHCAPVFHGFMEGAARSGVRAAEEVLAALGRVPTTAY